MLKIKIVVAHVKFLLKQDNFRRSKKFDFNHYNFF